MFPVPSLVVGGTSDAPLRSALKDIISAEAGLTANAAVTAKPASVERTNLVIFVFLQLIRFPADVFGDGSCGVTQPVTWSLGLREADAWRRWRGTLAWGGRGGGFPPA